MKSSFIIAIVLLACWLVFAQSCMTFRISDKKAVEDFRKKGIELKTYRKNVNGHTIHYVQTGADSLPTLLFVHGTPGSWTAFESYLQDSLLLTKFRLISIDRPGFGDSDFGIAMELMQQSELMGSAIKTMSNGKACWFVGHSMGAPIILQLEVDHPGIATGLVLISGSIDPAAEKPEKWRPVLFKTPLNLLVPGAMRPSNEELWYLKDNLKTLAKQLNQVTCPVYFIHGRQDTWVPPSNVYFGLKMLSGTQKKDTVWLEGNHFIPWTKFKQIRDYLYDL
jgi:pimeloyl-ACP methyl ester carboxylesterase